MTSLENLQELEHKFRALLSEREQLKSRLEQREAAAHSKSGDQDSEELQRSNDLWVRERSALRDRVESMLAAISRLSVAG